MLPLLVPLILPPLLRSFYFSTFHHIITHIQEIRLTGSVLPDGSLNIKRQKSSSQINL